MTALEFRYHVIKFNIIEVQYKIAKCVASFLNPSTFELQQCLHRLIQ